MFVKNCLIDSSPPWGVKEIVTEPYKNGWRHLSSAFEPAAQGTPTLRHRVCRVLVGLSLLIPIINMLIYIALRILFPGQQRQVLVHNSTQATNHQHVAQNQSSSQPSFDKWRNQVECVLNSPGNKHNLLPLFEEGQRCRFLNRPFIYFVGCTILHELAKRGISEYIVPLVTLGADLSLQENLFGNTPLMWAIANAQHETAMALMQAGGKKAPHLGKQCRRGNSALHLATAKGYKDINWAGQPLSCSSLDLVNQLIANGAPLNLQNNDGNTPLHLACLRRDCSMIASLLKAGADKTIRNNADKLPEDLLDCKYAESYAIIHQTVSPFLLSQKEHSASRDMALSFFT